MKIFGCDVVEKTEMTRIRKGNVWRHGPGAFRVFMEVFAGGAKRFFIQARFPNVPFMVLFELGDANSDDGRRRKFNWSFDKPSFTEKSVKICGKEDEALWHGFILNGVMYEIKDASVSYLPAEKEGA